MKIKLIYGFRIFQDAYEHLVKHRDVYIKTPVKTFHPKNSPYYFVGIEVGNFDPDEIASSPFYLGDEMEYKGILMATAEIIDFGNNLPYLYMIKGD